MRFTVLASGSGGNASLIEVDGFGLLVDIGLGPRQLAARLARVRRSWDDVDAVLLTHTHGDHWNGRTLAHLARRNIPLWCHAEHRRSLKTADKLQFHHYQADEPIEAGPGVSCRPIRLAHDEPTFGFRIEGSVDLFGRMVLGYAADLGSWSAELAQALADVDVLALEFNHDVDMEMSSGRSPYLIRRVLGSQGHLSNAQAAALVGAILGQSTPGRLQHLVLLHLSRDCNRPQLAETAARAALGAHAAVVHTARQDRPLRPIGSHCPIRRQAPRRPVRSHLIAQPILPGFE